jgi:hypothetical protein
VPEAWVLATLGEVDAAFARLEHAEAEYQAFLYFTGLPAFDRLRADARFAAMLERLGLPAAFATFPAGSLKAAAASTSSSVPNVHQEDRTCRPPDAIF